MTCGNDSLVELFEQMLLIRRFEEKIKELYMKGIIQGMLHLCIGQEAVAVGVCANLTKDELTCEVSSEISAIVAEYGMYNLSAPIKRVAVPDTPIPFAPVMEQAAIPNERKIIEAVRAVMA